MGIDVKLTFVAAVIALSVAAFVSVLKAAPPARIYCEGDHAIYSGRDDTRQGWADQMAEASRECAALKRAQDIRLQRMLRNANKPAEK